MNNEVRTWIEKMSNETAQCKCGKKCEVFFTIRNHLVEVRTYCFDCDRTLVVRESVSCVKEAYIDLVDEMLKALKRKFQEKGNE